MSKHPIVHIEFAADDLEAIAKFYSDVFGWKTQHIPEMNYVLFDTGEGVGGGFNPVGENSPAETTLAHIGTDNIPESLAQIEAHGGQVIVPETEIPEIGWYALFKDISGNVVALYKGKPQPDEA